MVLLIKMANVKMLIVFVALQITCIYASDSLYFKSQNEIEKEKTATQLPLVIWHGMGKECCENEEENMRKLSTDCQYTSHNQNNDCQQQHV